MSKISYEWDLETIDENGDIVNHDHSYTLKELNKISRNQRLVLVCDQVDGWGNLTKRSWADVDDDALPQSFDCGRKVPQKFHRELNHVVLAATQIFESD